MENELDTYDETTPELDPSLLLSAYVSGIFPMAMDDGQMAWFSPDPRGILPITGFHVSHNLRAKVRQKPFTIGVDTAFDAVMRGCAARSKTWINDSILRAYGKLHVLGVAHSVEAWRDGRLVGGLYGVAIRGAFFGESMFSVETDASKVCLVHLTERLRLGGYVLHDTQWLTPHLRQFGGTEIPAAEYQVRLAAAMDVDATWNP